MKQKEYLTRYTDLPSLLHILKTVSLTLLSPRFWDDKNDVYFMEKFIEKSQQGSILALCFTAKNETYHHWKVFSSGNSGVAIRFKKDLLLRDLEQQGVEHGKVKYYWIDKLPSQPLELEKLPFSKRGVFEDEEEYRIIYKHQSKDLLHKDFKIDLTSISEIRLSPWMHKNVVKSVKAAIKEVNPNINIKCVHSKLVDFERWKKLAD